MRESDQSSSMTQPLKPILNFVIDALTSTDSAIDPSIIPQHVSFFFFPEHDKLRLCICNLDTETVESAFRNIQKHEIKMKRIVQNNENINETNSSDHLVMFYSFGLPNTKLQRKEDTSITIEAFSKELNDIYKEHPHLENLNHVENLLLQRINLLHDYNEAKDAGQALLGQLAHLEGCTIKDMYEEFGLSLND